MANVDERIMIQRYDRGQCLKIKGTAISWRSGSHVVSLIGRVGWYTSVGAVLEIATNKRPPLCLQVFWFSLLILGWYDKRAAFLMIQDIC